MKSKMKQCNSCGQLVSNSAKKCFKCGSIDLARGTISDGNLDELEMNVQIGSNDNKKVFHCPVCKFSVTLKGHAGECPTCGEYLCLDENMNDIRSL